MHAFCDEIRPIQVLAKMRQPQRKICRTETLYYFEVIAIKVSGFDDASNIDACPVNTVFLVVNSDIKGQPVDEVTAQNPLVVARQICSFYLWFGVVVITPKQVA